MHKDADNPEDDDLPVSDLDRHMEAFFLAGEDDDALKALLMQESVDDPEKLLRLVALNELAEEGLELLAAEGLPQQLMDVESGRRIGGYRLIQEIGSGGMGVVFLAEDTALGRLVALKLLSRVGSKTIKRFHLEAEITASLDHPNIVPVYGRGEENGVEFLVMRYIAGKDIESTISQSRGRDSSATFRLYDEVVAWMSDIADALHHAHETGILHRDVKPSNILVEKGTPFIVDFGLASHEEQIQLTQPGDMLGTVPYMSPEQVRGENESLDRRGDVYSFGATLYHLLAGAVPFAGRSTQAVARQILTRDPPALRAYGVPKDLEAIVFRCLEKEPERRYQTAADLSADLRRFLEQLPVRARHLGPVRRGLRTAARHKKLVALLLFVLVFVLAGGSLILKSRSDRLAAQMDVYEAAMQSAEREKFSYAAHLLGQLSEEGASIEGLEESLSRVKKHDLHDRLMTLLYMRNSIGGGQAIDPDGGMTDLLERAEALGRPDVLTDHFRFIQIVVLKRLGRVKEAVNLLNSWDQESAGSNRRTRLLRAYLAREGERAMAKARIEELIGDDESTTLEDHYFAGFVLALFPGGREAGLREINIWVSQRPSNYWGRFIRGNLLRQNRRFDAAREVYSGLVGNLSLSSEKDAGDQGRLFRATIYQRGLLSSRLGDFESALADFRKTGDFLKPWVLEKALAYCLSGLGRHEEAILAYDRAIGHLNELKQNLPESGRRRQRWQESLVSAITEKGRAQMALGQFEIAEDTFATLAVMPGRYLEAKELAAFLLVERVRNSALDSTFGLPAVEGELREMAEENPESQVIRFLLSELRIRIGELDEQKEICNELYSRENVGTDSRMWRAWLSFLYIHNTKRTSLFRYKPIDITELEEELWDLTFVEIDRAAHRAADDLAMIQIEGFDRLTGLFRDAVMARFLLATLQFWSHEPRQAVALYSELSKRKDISQKPWAPMMFALHGMALEELGLTKRAHLVYSSALSQRNVDDWTLTLAPRLAAKEKRWKDLKAILELVAKKQPKPGWLKTELSKSPYTEARKEGHLSLWE